MSRSLPTRVVSTDQVKGLNIRFTTLAPFAVPMREESQQDGPMDNAYATGSETARIQKRRVLLDNQPIGPCRFVWMVSISAFYHSARGKQAGVPPTPLEVWEV